MTIDTGDVANGGTDGTVSLAIEGRRGSTGMLALDTQAWQRPSDGQRAAQCDRIGLVIEHEENPSDSFEAGSTELFGIFGADVGQVTGARLRMDANGTAGAGWMLQSVSIEKGVELAGGWRRSGTPLKSSFNNWLESGKEQKLTENSGESNDYTFTFLTGTDSGAGTDSDITIRLEGTNFRGKTISFERNINAFLSGNAFENGQRDTATIKGLPSMERLTSVTITTADNYAGSAWQLNSVEISSPALCGGEAGVPCRFGVAEKLSFGNVWLDSNRLSAKVRARSIDDRGASPGAGAPQSEFCYRMAAELDFEESVAAGVCTHTKDAIRDLACVVMARKLGEDSLDAWAGKCVSDPNGAAAELWRIFDGQSAAKPKDPEPGAEPAPEGRPAPPTGGGSEEERCMGLVDGRVAYDRNGSKAWNPENIAALCAGAADADARIACFEDRIAAGEDWSTAIPACAADDGAAARPRSPDGSSAEADRCKALLQDQVPWQIDPPERHWAEEDLDALCSGSTNAPATVRCFQDALWNNGYQSDIQTAIAACRED